MKHLCLAALGFGVLLLVAFACGLWPEQAVRSPAEGMICPERLNGSIPSTVEVFAYHSGATEKIRISLASFLGDTGEAFRCAGRIGVEAPVDKTGEDILVFLKFNLPNYRWEIISTDFFRGVLE